MRRAWVLLCVCAAFGQEKELKDAAGNTIIRYVLETPRGMAPAGTKDPAKQVGLFLCFPEHERPTGDELLPVRESLRRQGLSDQFVLLAGHSQALKMSLADHEPIRTLTEWAMANFPINPRRIYMYGKGEGGKVSGEFAGLHPKLITAAITYSWGWWVMPPEMNQRLDGLGSAPELYMVLGLRDLATHIATVRDTYTRVRAKGFHVIYREFDDLGARTYHPASNDDAIAWVTRLRNKNLAPSEEEAHLLKSPRVGEGGYFHELALVGGAPAGAVVQRLLASEDAAVRAAAAETCTRAYFDEGTAGVLGRGLRDADVRVRRAALRGLAMYANWRSQIAQTALMDLALNPDKAVDTADRISAVDALGYAVRFQVKGVRQDPPVFRALVTLLADKDEAVRTMASNILVPIRDPEFRGDAGRPEKKAPEGGWPLWLAKIEANEAGLWKDYDVCANRPLGGSEPMDWYCAGAPDRPVTPQVAFEDTRKAAQADYIPAQAALGMMYANGTGVEQNYVEAGKWWGMAASGGHTLAGALAARAPKVPVPGAIVDGAGVGK